MLVEAGTSQRPALELALKKIINLPPNSIDWAWISSIQCVNSLAFRSVCFWLSRSARCLRLATRAQVLATSARISPARCERAGCLKLSARRYQPFRRGCSMLRGKPNCSLGSAKLPNRSIRVLAGLFVALISLAGGQAAWAHVNPPNCIGNKLDVALERVPIAIANGDTTTWTVT